LRCAQCNDGGQASFCTSIVHRDVESPEAAHRGVDHVGDLALEPDIGTDKQCVGGPHRCEVTGQPFAGIVVATGDHDDIAALRESQCGRLTDPT